MHDPANHNDNAAQGGPKPPRVDPDDEVGLAYWRDHFGVTVEQLAEAVQAVGGDPQAVREHLLNQGASAGAG